MTIQISNGPKTSAVPDVTSEDYQQAGTDLHAAGFNVHVTRQDVSDPSQEGIVLSQDPAGGSQAKPGTVVTLVVGSYSGGGTGTTTTIP